MYIDKTTTTPNTLTEVTQTDSPLTTTEITNSIPTTTEVDHFTNIETKTMRTMNVEKTTVSASKTNDSNENGLNKGPRVGENNITDMYPRTTVGLDENEFSSVIDDNITTTTESSDSQTTQASTDYVTLLTTTDKDHEPDFTRSDSVITTKSTQFPTNQSSVATSTESVTATDIPTTTEPDVTTEPTTLSLKNQTTTKNVPTTKSVNMDFPSATESDDSFRMMDTTKSVDGTTHSENTRKTTRFDTSLEHHDEQTTKTAIGVTEATDATTLLTTNDAQTQISIIDSVTKAITQKCNRTTDCTSNEKCVDGRCTKGIIINISFLSLTTPKLNN